MEWTTPLNKPKKTRQLRHRNTEDQGDPRRGLVNMKKLPEEAIRTASKLGPGPGNARWRLNGRGEKVLVLYDVRGKVVNLAIIPVLSIVL